MKFDFSNISFTGMPGANSAREPICREQNGAEKYVDTILNSSTQESQERDSINDFYSDLANSMGVLRHAPTDDLSQNRLERTLAINKNTVDRHGRT